MLATPLTRILAITLGGVLTTLVIEAACPAPPRVVYGPFARLEAAEAPIRITLDKHVGFAPLDIRVRVLVPPHPDNRNVCLFMEGPLRTNSSCFPHLPDARSERTVSYVRLPEGSYVFWAVLERTGTDAILSAAETAEVQ